MKEYELRIWNSVQFETESIATGF